MTIASMTGFARSEGFHEGTGWSWEIRSVNARNLDVRFRLPTGHDQLEIQARSAIAKRFKRGNLSISLNITQTARPSQVRVNREVLDQVVALAGELKAQTGVAASPDGLLALKGVLETADDEGDLSNRDARFDAMASSLEEALDRLANARADEGGRLVAAIEDHLAEIQRLSSDAHATAAAQPDAIKSRLKQQLDEILDESATISSDRLEQEIALLAAKADVREELDRLESHVAAAKELIAAGGPAGRRLDFLCQEFNREANTLCSKSSDVALTRIGLDLKAAIDRLREQVQNIE